MIRTINRILTFPSSRALYLKRMICNVNLNVDKSKPSKSEDIKLPHESQLSEHISMLAAKIIALNLVEVSELRKILQQKLNIPDFMPSMGGIPQSGNAESDSVESEDHVIKTSFTLQLKGFEDGKKVALIKEIRNIMTDMNLVQAKKFVESLPHVVLENVGKDEAEKVMKQLEALGGICLLE